MTQVDESFRYKISIKQAIGIILGIILFFLGLIIIALNPDLLILGIVMIILGFSLILFIAPEQEPDRGPF